MGHSEDQERLRVFKRDFPEEYAAKVAEILYRKKHENEFLEEQGYFVACRSWKIILTRMGLRLLSSSDIIWPTYEKLVAVCSNGQQHIVPDRECMCGIYGMRLGNSIPIDGSVQGRVGLWGRYVQGDTGYRTQFAYPVKLESFKCSQCGGVFEEWGEAYGSTGDRRIVRLRCITCYNEEDRFDSKYSSKFFSGADVIRDLNEAYGLVLSQDDMLDNMLEGINLDLEG